MQVLGDSALTGLAKKLPSKLAGGKVKDDVKGGRTTQQGENDLNELPDSAPAVFVISLAEDDTSNSNAYTARIDELMLLLSGRTVYWITAPGKDAYTKIVNAENAPDQTDPQTYTSWQIVDFAASVKQHSDWWIDGKPTDAGLTNLAKTLQGYLGGNSGSSSGSSGATSGTITVTSTTNSGNNVHPHRRPARQRQDHRLRRRRDGHLGPRPDRRHRDRHPGEPARQPAQRRPRLSRAVPAAPEPGLGDRRPGHRPRPRGHRVLRAPAARVGMGRHGRHRRSAGSPALRHPRRLRPVGTIGHRHRRGTRRRSRHRLRPAGLRARQLRRRSSPSTPRCPSSASRTPSPAATRKARRSASACRAPTAPTTATSSVSTAPA